MVKSIYILAITTIGFLNVQAQGTMTLDDCMKYAVENSLAVKKTQEQNHQATTTRREAFFNAFSPNVNAYSDISLISGRTPDPSTNLYTDLKMLQDQYQISGSITLFDGFKAINDIKTSKIAVLNGRTNEQIKNDEICLSTMQAFYNVLYYKKLHEVIESQVQNAETDATRVKKEVELGQKSRYDVLEKESFCAELKYKLATTKATLNAAMLLLKETMNFPNDEPLEIDTTFNDTELQTAATEQIVQYARENAPELAVVKNKTLMSELDFKTAKWQCLPSLNLNAGWVSSHSMLIHDFDLAPSFHDQIKNNAQKYIQLQLNIPIFNKLSFISNVSRKKSDYKISQLELQEKQREIENEVYKAADERNSAEAAMHSAKQNAAFQLEYLEISKKKFQQGLTPYIEFNTVNNKFLESYAQYLNAVFTFKIKDAVLRYYNGEGYL